jgi:hypothetical protein
MCILPHEDRQSCIISMAANVQAKAGKRFKTWSLLATCNKALRELLAVLDLADKHGTTADQHAADRLARR